MAPWKSSSRELVRADLADEVLVGGEELGESTACRRRGGPGTTSVRLPSVFSTSTARPRLTCSWWTTRGLPSAPSTKRGVHDRHVVGDGPHHRVADEVGEADLAAARAAEVAVDHAAVDLEQLGRARSRKLVAVGTARLASMLATIAAPAPRIGSPGLGGCVRSPRRRAGVGGRRRSERGRSSGRRGRRRRRRDSDRAGLVVGEELAASSRSPTRVGAVLLVHLVDEPRVRPELLGRVVLRALRSVCHASMLPAGPARPGVARVSGRLTGP